MEIKIENAKGLEKEIADIIWDGLGGENNDVDLIAHKILRKFATKLANMRVVIDETTQEVI